MADERAAGTEGALDLEASFVPLEGVLDDRKPQPRAAARARAALVDAVKTLGQARDVIGRHADAGVGYGEARASAGLLPAHADAPALRRVLHGVGDQVRDDALRLGLAPVQQQIGV